ncbi:hypothetical protein T492DRAFT_601379, partial [Pavlovales sp. CCMP2436]
MPSGFATVVTEGAPPYRIVHVSEAWCQLTGYSAHEVVGHPCTFMQTEATCRATLAALGEAVRRKESIAVQLINVDRLGRPFLNTLHVAPLADASGGYGNFYG